MINWLDRLIEKHSLQWLLTERNFSYFILVVTFLLGVYLNWTLEAVIMLMFIVWHVMHPVKTAILINLLSLSLVLIPAILFVHRPETAESFSIGAFFLFVLLLLQLLSERKKDAVDE